MRSQVSTTPELLAARAETMPDALCLVDAETGQRTTYGDLWQDSLRMAGRLRALGISPGDVVATMLPHSVSTYRVWFALALLGATEVPIGTRYRGRLLDHLLRDSAAVALVVDLARTPELEDALADRPPGVVLLDPGNLLEGPVPEPRSLRLPQLHDVSTVIYTSGTTGPSKGVLVPWGQVHATVTGAFPPGTMAPGKVVYGPFPPNHVGGRLFACLGIEHGVPTVLRHTFSASAFWSDVEQHGCTTVGLVAAMASILLEAEPTTGDGRNSLHDVLVVPLIARHDELARRFGVRVCTSFNMTEVSIPIATGWTIGDWRSCGSVREGPPGYRLRLVDEADRPVAVGEVGELVCRTDSPWAMNAGYLGRPAETAAAWRNGWFHTGDAFRCDADGHYYFVDRAKDAIRRRGENISSFEVEQEVLDHPDVEACAAIGVPADLGEEEVKVFVVRRLGSGLTADELVAHVAARAAKFMVPRFVEFVDELPVTEGTGRVRKAELRELERRRVVASEQGGVQVAAQVDPASDDVEPGADLR